MSPLTRFTIVLLGIYMALKVGDMMVRGTYVYLLDGSIQSRSFIVEMLFGVIIPWVMLLSSGGALVATLALHGLYPDCGRRGPQPGECVSGQLSTTLCRPAVLPGHW